MTTAATDAAAIGESLELYRVSLTGYCYRLLGSSVEAEDAVQDTLVKAWNGIGGLADVALLRSWVFRIATNVCMDLLRGRKRRAVPMDLEGPSLASTPLRPPVYEQRWLEPVPDQRVLTRSLGSDPAETAVERASIRLAFVAALQFLPPRQRAVLVLRDVLGWKADEVAELLDTSVASVNSALQRARATMGQVNDNGAQTLEPSDSSQRELLSRYVEAFQRYDMTELTKLLHEDATQSMPPFEQWFAGREEIFSFWQGPGIGCKGSILIPTVANGFPAFAQYKPNPAGDGHEPWALQVLHIVDDRIVEFCFFLDTKTLFPLFGLPDRLPVAGEQAESHVS